MTPRDPGLRRLGEFGLIARLARFCPTASPRLPLGIGDDAAIVTLSPRRQLLVTTDLLVETVDFDRRVWSFATLGEKALAVNLSDVAAMGGRPSVFFVGLALPPQATVREVDALYRGLGRAARRYGVVLGGGDLSAAPVWSIAITLLGEIERGAVLTRSGAKAGDWLCVTGTLGDSGCGLELLSAPRTARRVAVRERRFLIDRHQRPVPRLACGQLLAGRRLATAAIDLSDGLASDLRRVCEASGVGAEIDLRALPLSGALQSYAASVGRDPITYALTSGEDFELLFSVPPARLDRVLRLSTRDLPITPIGRILPRRAGLRVIDPAGRRRPLQATGYDHFRRG
ncbi:MAG: thiamine-phosphate kinase [Nitrospirae bacterium]|nr:thiamine-phosphate kinase [Nitrospirota bacterium]